MRLKPQWRKAFLHAVLTLHGFPGVVGVFWGQGQRRGRWIRQGCLCVHVQWKRPLSQLPASERLPTKLNGIPLDVLEVGKPRLHAGEPLLLDHTDEVLARGVIRPRNATITALATTPLGTLALLSGHAVLPFANGSIVRDFAGEVDASIQLVDPLLQPIRGRVFSGQFGEGRAIDWALAVVPDIDADALLTRHYAAGAQPPLLFRRALLGTNMPVYHYSRLPHRRRIMRGVIQQVAVSEVIFSAPDGTDATYSDLIVVAAPPGLPFSLEGDSGSLVVDERGGAVGSVVGGTKTGATAYVAPIHAVLSRLGKKGRYFFK